MSVPVHLRQESDFEVFNSWTKLDLQLTELMLGDFGYTVAKEQKRKQPVYDENMTDEKLENYTASWYRVHRKYMSGQQKRKYKKQTFKLLEVTHGYDYTDRWSYYQRFNS